MAVGKLGKVGNSLVVRIPAAIVRELDLKDGQTVELLARYGELTLRTGARSRLDRMLDTVKEREGEYDWGPDVGREIVD